MSHSLLLSPLLLLLLAGCWLGKGAPASAPKSGAPSCSSRRLNAPPPKLPLILLPPLLPLNLLLPPRLLLKLLLLSRLL